AQPGGKNGVRQTLRHARRRPPHPERSLTWRRPAEPEGSERPGGPPAHGRRPIAPGGPSVSGPGGDGAVPAQPAAGPAGCPVAPRGDRAVPLAEGGPILS